MKKITTLLTLLFTAVLAWAAGPVEPTTLTADGNFAPGTRWYTMAITNSKLVISDNEGDDFIPLTNNSTDYADKDLWCFVLADDGGYAIYNKQAGSSKVLCSPADLSANTGGNGYLVLKDAADMPADYLATWDITAYTKTDVTAEGEPWLVSQHGKSANAINNRNGKLAFWTTGVDAGSAVFIEFAQTEVPVRSDAGEWTATNATGTWAASWRSGSTPQFTISTAQNNMMNYGGTTDIQFFTGGSLSCNYTINVSDEDYAVLGYRFNFTANAKSVTVTPADGEAVTATATEAGSISVSGLTAATTTFNVSTSSGSTDFANTTEFYVTVGRTSANSNDPNTYLFKTFSGSIPYRIPAIAQGIDGTLCAVTDYRPCGSDIGYGRVDLRYRLSNDNGATWGKETVLVEGDGKTGSPSCGYGDPAIVADAESPRMLLICVTGNTICTQATRQNPNRVARFYSDDNGRTWSAPEEITESIYTIFDNSAKGVTQSIFFGSGRICQSRQVKVGEYYRLYAALWTQYGSSRTMGNRVIYSDDFGQTWHELGNDDVPAPGNEPKVEELPDGSVLLSSRTAYGRYFNIFTYADQKGAKGQWGSYTLSNDTNNGTHGADCNGEILIVPAKRNSDGANVFVALQSIPFGTDRSNVGIYYKALDEISDFETSLNFAINWEGSKQISNLGSAYSTMIVQADNRIAFYFEEATYGAGYTEVYRPLTLEEITNDAYSLNPELKPEEYMVKLVVDQVNGMLEAEGGNIVGMIDPDMKQDVAKALETYKEDGSAEARQALYKAIEDASIQIMPGQLYRIVNTSNGLSLAPNTSNTFKVSDTDLTTSEQYFEFVPDEEADGAWKIYSANYESFFKNTTNANASVTQTTNEAAAGVYTVKSAANGESAFSCRNATNSAAASLSLNASNTMIGGGASTSSMWNIVPVSSYTVCIPESGMATMNWPYYVILPEGLTAYTAVSAENDGSEGVIGLLPVEEEFVEPATPVIVKGTPGESYELEIVTLVATPYSEPLPNLLQGTLKGKAVGGNDIFLLTGSEGTPAFTKRVKVADGPGANRAYLKASTADAAYNADVTAYSIVIKDPTAITGVPETGNASPVRFYDLQGRRVMQPAGGIYITDDGRKVFLK